MNRRQLLTGMAVLAGARAARGDAPGPPQGPIRRIELAEDARFAFTIDRVGVIRVWETASGEMPYALPASWDASARLSPDSRYLATSLPQREEGQVALRETKSGKVLWERRAAGSTEFRFTPDGTALVIITDRLTRRLSYSVAVADVSGGRSLWPLGRIWDRAVLAISPDSSTLAAWEPEGGKPAILLHDLRKGNVQGRIPVETWVGGMEFSPDGKLLAITTGGGLVELRDSGSGRVRCRLPEPPLGKLAGTPELRFSPDGKWLATAPPPVEDRLPRAGTVRLWSSETGVPAPALAEAAGALQPVFSPDSSLLAAVQPDGVLRLWDVKTGALLRSLGEPERKPLPAVGQHRFTPDGRKIVAVSAAGIRRWEVRSGKLEQFWPFR